MSSDNNKKEFFLTKLIILVAVVGVIYFGYQAIQDTNRSNQENPFEYNIDNFKKSDSNLFHYKLAKQYRLNFENVYAIALDRQERIFVSGDQSIQILDYNGNRLNIITCGQAVTAMAIDNTGKIYAAIKNGVQVYDGYGGSIASWDIPSPDPIITSLAIHPSGIYVADAQKKAVWKFDISGKLLGQIGPEKSVSGVPEFVIPSPYFDVAVDPDGFIWIVNPGNHSLENYTSKGEYRSAWGMYSMNAEGFCGCCNPSHLALLADGSFVTSEKGIPRIKIYNRLGQLVSIVAGPEQFDDDTIGLDLAVDSENRIFVLYPKKKSVLVFQKIQDKVLSIR